MKNMNYIFLNCGFTYNDLFRQECFNKHIYVREIDVSKLLKISIRNAKAFKYELCMAIILLEQRFLLLV